MWKFSICSNKTCRYPLRSSLLSKWFQWFLFISNHCVKSIHIRDFFLFRTFPHSDWIRKNSSYLRIQSECGKIRTEKTPYLDTIHTVNETKFISFRSLADFKGGELLFAYSVQKTATKSLPTMRRKLYLVSKRLFKIKKQRGATKTLAYELTGMRQRFM